MTLLTPHLSFRCLGASPHPRHHVMMLQFPAVTPLRNTLEMILLSCLKFYFRLLRQPAGIHLPPCRCVWRASPPRFSPVGDRGKSVPGGKTVRLSVTIRTNPPDDPFYRNFVLNPPTPVSPSPHHYPFIVSLSSSPRPPTLPPCAHNSSASLTLSEHIFPPVRRTHSDGRLDYLSAVPAFVERPSF